MYTEDMNGYLETWIILHECTDKISGEQSDCTIPKCLM